MLIGILKMSLVMTAFILIGAAVGLKILSRFEQDGVDEESEWMNSWKKHLKEQEKEFKNI